MGAAARRPALGLKIGVRNTYPIEGVVYGTVIEHLSTQFTMIDEDERIRIVFYTDDWFNAEKRSLLQRGDMGLCL